MSSKTIALAALAATISLSACKKNVDTEPDMEPPAPAADISPDPVETPAQPMVEEVRANFERVFFALDSSSLVDDALVALEDNAAILQANPEIVVSIQGHADERGTVDYNLALGDERATAVHDALVGMGVDPDQLQTVSFGEERPLSDEDGEQAWAKDRRAEFRVLKDPTRTAVGTVGEPVEDDAPVVVE